MPDDERPPGRRYQYSLSTLLLITALVSVLAAALAGMLQRQRGGASMPAGFFVLMAVAAPLAVMIVVSALRGLLRLWTRRR